MKYVDSLIGKLVELRPANRIFADKTKDEESKFNIKKFEVLPINFIRGMDIENAFVIIDETQNLTRHEVRALLSRFGENCKCICIGDTSQIDNPYLNEHNNGLNWILRKFKGQKNYAHLTMKSDKYRGPICQLVVETGL
jgi:PhoH-like ATPase